MASIRIVNIPEGEAPLHIRQAWIGCTLPLPNNAYGSRRNWRWVGVLTGQNRSWLAQLFLLGKPMVGYPVYALDALKILESHNPAAAQWWRQNTPRLFKPNRMLVFDAVACEEVPFG
jgi:hypothetical protein